MHALPQLLVGSRLDLCRPQGALLRDTDTIDGENRAVRVYDERPHLGLCRGALVLVLAES